MGYKVGIVSVRGNPLVNQSCPDYVFIMSGHRNEPETGGRYPMRLVTRLTGLSADVIRVWERRYGAVVPERSDGGTRLYSERDLRRLILLKAAVDAGHTIRAIATLEEEKLRALSDQAGAEPVSRTSASDGWGDLIERYLEHVTRFDAEGAGDLLARAMSVSEGSVFVFELILPLLREVGDRWHAGTLSVAHEHLVSAQVKGFLFTFTRLLRPLPGAPRLVIATPAGHLHEFGALVGAYLAAARGLNTVYLGADVPDEDLVGAAEQGKADVLLLSVLLDPDGPSRRRLRETLRRCAESVETWIGTPPEHDGSKHPPLSRHFTSFEDLDAAFTMLVTRS